jgi:Cdc6-like AAA superfamily ATPase
VTPTPPTLSQEQRVEASRLAVANRRRRAEVKRMVKSGELSLEELFDLASREECVAQMRAYDLISALPAIGDVKAERIMKSASIAKTRRIRGLGPKQRAELFRALVR